MLDMYALVGAAVSFPLVDQVKVGSIVQARSSLHALEPDRCVQRYGAISSVWAIHIIHESRDGHQFSWR